MEKYGKIFLGRRGIMNIFQEEINYITEKYARRLSIMKKELQLLKGGTIYIKHGRKGLIVTEYKNGKEKAIGKNKDKVYKLARRRYLLSMTRQLEEVCSELNRLSRNIRTTCKKYDQTSFLESCRELNLDLTKVCSSTEQQKWMEENEETNPHFKESAKYITKNGIAVRSKSEKIIADMLVDWGIVFKYEMPLVINGITYYPDFTIFTESGEIIYWEHLGLMDDDAYFLKNCRKLRNYRLNGLSDHTNLIVTWEADLFDMETLENIIKTRLI